MKRRDFLGNVGKVAFSTWLGADLFAGAATSLVVGASTEMPSQATSRGILTLRVRTIRIDEMHHFYGTVMGFDTERDERTLRVRTGETTILFDRLSESNETTGSSLNYHIAWAIPENKFNLSKKWLAERTPLLKDATGTDEFYFRYVNRRGVYFEDPDGNVLELIARHDLKDAADGDFSLSDLLYVNHVGLAADDVAATVRELGKNLGLKQRGKGWPGFMSVGDPHRHVTIVKRNRLWIPERIRAAGVYETDIVLHGAPEKSYEFESLPYRIGIEAG